MCEPEKNDAKRLTETVEAVNTLPAEQKNYLMGYARGLADALADRQIAESSPEVMKNTDK